MARCRPKSAGMKLVRISWLGVARDVYSLHRPEMKTCPFFARLACVLWFGSVSIAHAEFYTFTTIAGLAGQIGSVDGTNSDARFNYPCEIAIDGAGVIYVTDLLNHTIRKMVAAGTNWAVTTIAGMAGVAGSADGTNTDARFNRPNGIVADLAGNLFVADHYNETIRKLTQSGTNWIVTTVAGMAAVRGTNDGSNSDARFWAPVGVAVDKNEHLFVADASNFTIRGILPAGTNWIVSTLAGTALIYGFADGVNDAAEFDYPYNIALTGAGVLYVTDFGNYAIRQITPVGPDWVTRTIAGFSGVIGTNDGAGGIASFNNPNGIAVDGATNLYV